MDGSSFDKLSVSVHRLREQASRRNALRLLLGGAAAVSGILASQPESEAKKKKKKRRKRCRTGYGGRCKSNRDCCNGKCRNGICWYKPGGGGGNGGRNCNGVRCPNGWRCCNFQGFRRCLPNNHPACIGYGECPFAWETCGWNGSIRHCCGLNQRCCYSNSLNQHICLPDTANCDNFNRSAEIESEAMEGVSDPIPVTDIDPSEYE
jgi:hypothetical protein